MSLCKSKLCFPTETSCFEGHADVKQCSKWIGGTSNNPTANELPSDLLIGSQVMWTGRALGTIDLLPLSSRGYLKVIGLIGPANAGKTSFLITLYLLLLKEGKIGTYTFAGSTTLSAWELLASHLRHSAQHPLSFPPHTTSMERVPSLLHLAFRDEHGKYQDVVFTDTPGEWFIKWAASAADVAAEGARWIIEKSDSFILFADSSALAGAQRGAARQNLVDLIRRLGAETKNRPVEFVWAKSDLPVKQEIKDQITKARQDFLPEASENAVSVLSETGCHELVKVIELLFNRINTHKEPLREPYHPNTPFLAYRGSK